eukprot:CAMPEP_0178456020 /NCGR_PEP_ID=MMETSP0689_2-20121128/46230_1 /TAXON_ID=160604 /ORGANISM="Amphidinium massartii, Strain CS-259" /LENGTH=81 /DNA_ID=CAMNT_0020082115 /DNA_START=475 /DNA_END=717 /DNA_ORIENTATION=-
MNAHSVKKDHRAHIWKDTIPQRGHQAENEARRQREENEGRGGVHGLLRVQAPRDSEARGQQPVGVGEHSGAAAVVDIRQRY